MQKTDGDRRRLGERLGRARLPSKTTWGLIPVLAMSVVTAVAVTFLALRNGVIDTTEGIVLGITSLGAVIAVVTLLRARSAADDLSQRITAVRAAARRVTDSDLSELSQALRDPDAARRPIASLELDTESQDEIGALNRTFVDLHKRLSQVAGRQMETLKGGVSDLIISLARRNTSLVNRQLAELDELEAGETDPKTLAGFYRVDHIASRMRRNAESLLVLAGEETPRPMTEPAEMVDLIRAAIGEIEDYLRVQIDAVQPAKVSGQAVADLTHLIAELLDNATEYSPPEANVKIAGRALQGGYVLTVTDRGLGLDPARLNDLNDTLSSPPPLGLKMEPHMGIHVVSRLAARHDMGVSLRDAMPGVVAEVLIPDALLTVRDEKMIDLDRESQEYIYKMRKKWKARAETAAEGLGRHAESTVSSPPGDGGDLPVRVPGKAYQDQYGAEDSSVADGDGNIKSALSAFEEGRQAASRGGKIVDLDELGEGHS